MKTLPDSQVVDRVKKILSENPSTRDHRNLLIYYYWLEDQTGYWEHDKFVDDFIAGEIKIETITRIARLVQAQIPELAGTRKGRKEKTEPSFKLRIKAERAMLRQEFMQGQEQQLSLL
jgi:hypothetical protein